MKSIQISSSSILNYTHMLLSGRTKSNQKMALSGDEDAEKAIDSV
jgi:hypothetical protein